MTIINFKDEYPDKFEKSGFECIICGEKVREGDPIHECSEKKLKNMERGKKAAETRLDNRGSVREITTIDGAYNFLANEMLDPDFEDINDY